MSFELEICVDTCDRMGTRLINAFMGMATCSYVAE